jgi:hypothetical protein
MVASIYRHTGLGGKQSGLGGENNNEMGGVGGGGLDWNGRVENEDVVISLLVSNDGRRYPKAGSSPGQEVRRPGAQPK